MRRLAINNVDPGFKLLGSTGRPLCNRFALATPYFVLSPAELEKAAAELAEMRRIEEDDKQSWPVRQNAKARAGELERTLASDRWGREQLAMQQKVANTRGSPRPEPLPEGKPGRQLYAEPTPYWRT